MAASDVGPLGAEERAEAIFSAEPSGAAFDWLQSLFGSWVADVAGGAVASNVTVEATLLTVATGYANALALIIGIVISSYVIISSIIKTAHEGEILGKSWSTVWLPLRTALAFGMILPVAGGGSGHVSAVQAAAMWLVVMGSNSADAIWNGVAEEAVKTPVVAVSPVKGYSTVKELFSSSVCAISMQKDQEGLYGTEFLYSYYTKPDARLVGGMTPDDRARKNVKKATVLETNSIEEAIGAARVIKIMKGGVCGEVDLPAYDTDSSLSTNGLQVTDTTLMAGLDNEFETVGINIGTQKAIEVFKDMAIKVELIARDYVEIGGHSLGSEYREGEKERTLDIVKKLTDVIFDYEVAMGTEPLAAINSPSNNLASLFKASLTNRGWGYAGMFYWQMDKFAQMANSAVSSVDTSTAYGDPAALCFQDAWYSNIFDADKVVDKGETSCNAWKDAEFIKKILLKEISEYLGMIGGAAAKSPLGECADEDRCDSNSLMTTTTANWAANILTWTQGGNGAVATDGGASPYTTVTGIGRTMVNQGYVIVGVQLGVSGLASFLKELSSASAGPGGIMSALSSWVMMMALAAFGMGWVLAFVIPFLPTFIWVSQLLAWMLMVVESIIASPLHMIMAAMPEGEGISGSRQERGYTLLLGLTLRPSLMVIGLIASIAIGYVALGVFNSLFWSTTALIGEGPFEFLAIMSLYIGGISFLTKQVFSIMHKLPEQILEWMSSGGQRSMLGDSNFAGEVGGEMRQTGRSVGDALGKGAQGAVSDAGKPGGDTPGTGSEATDGGSSGDSKGGQGGGYAEKLASGMTEGGDDSGGKNDSGKDKEDKPA